MIYSELNINLTNHCNKTNQGIKSIKIKKKNSSKEVQQVAEIVSEIGGHFDALIDTSLTKILEVLDKKRRNIRYFTIAFMGRTKAGKSTLHKVITQQNDDDIGVGKLRTTRYNRSWYWDKLRVVDTPGIGAPGGERDTEIAKSIIDEADVICYVVTSDSIQETEFNFLESIKERNKPLYIILNVKSNLSQRIRLKKFLENPTDWRECSGAQSIQGHIDRIHDMLDGKYNMDAVEIIPIHLLAAQVGFSGEFDDKTSKTLYEGSNILSFTRSIKSEVHHTGGLKKSLSVIDGTAYQINAIRKSLLLDYNNIKDRNNLLKKKRSKFRSFVKEQGDRALKDIKDAFSSAKNELHNRAAVFASEHYEDSNAGELWERDATVMTIYSRLNERIIARMEDFNEKMKSEIEEIGSDIRIHDKISASANASGEVIINTRFGVGIVGTIFTAAAPVIISNLWHPGGWIMAGVTIGIGLIVTVFTSLFTSKAEKIRKAIDKMTGQLNTSIDKSINEGVEKTLSNVKSSIQNIQKEMDDILSTYIDNSDMLIRQMEQLCNKCKEFEASINSLISFRILEFIGKKVVKDKVVEQMDNEYLWTTYPVVRDWSNQSLKYEYVVSVTDKEKESAEKATQMKLIFKK